MWSLFDRFVQQSVVSHEHSVSSEIMGNYSKSFKPRKWTCNKKTYNTRWSCVRSLTGKVDVPLK